MDTVLLYRVHNGNIDFVRRHEADNEIKVWPDIEAAIEYAANSPLLQAVPYQIVELDEL